jgi:cation transport protein ChaC
MPHAPHDLWIFGYGSLMWKPGFDHVEQHHARLVGYRRSLCIYSVHYRGTPRRPGLVLGLDRGGVCEGVAFRVAGAGAAPVLEALRRRELIYPVYREARLPVSLLRHGGAEVEAVAFIAERCHPSYAGALPPTVKARLVRGAAGKAGTNIDYLANTLDHLAELGIRDARLERILAHVGPFAASGEAPASGRPRARAMTRTFGRTPADVPLMRKAELSRFGHRRMLESG